MLAYFFKRNRIRVITQLVEETQSIPQSVCLLSWQLGLLGGFSLCPESGVWQGKGVCAHMCIDN
jgi:hypothetical protein